MVPDIEAEYISLKCTKQCGFTNLLTYLIDHEMDPMIRENPVVPDGSKSYEISLFQRYDAKENHTHVVPSYTRADCRYLHQINFVKNGSLVKRGCR
jgi:hypothetical protein